MIPVFVGGTGRSGTTILKHSLMARPEFIGFKSELRLIVDPDGVLDLIAALDEQWSPYKGDIAIQRFRALLRRVRSTNIAKRALRRLLVGLNFSPPEYLALGVERELRPGTLGQVFEPVLAKLCTGWSRGHWIGSPMGQVPPRIAESSRVPKTDSAPLLASALRTLFGSLPGADRAVAFVEDTPFNILHARELFALFPDMYLIHIHRDPRDTIASYLGKEWGGTDIALTARRIRAIHDRWVEVRRGLPSERVFEIALEDLALAPAPTLRPLMNALGVSAEDMVPGISMEKANVGRWRNGLSAEQLRCIEEIFSISQTG